MAAARAYIYRHQIRKEFQFDIVSVVFDQEGHSIEYIPRAFYPCCH
jgi:hypothetical protein